MSRDPARIAVSTLLLLQAEARTHADLRVRLDVSQKALSTALDAIERAGVPLHRGRHIVAIKEA